MDVFEFVVAAHYGCAVTDGLCHNEAVVRGVMVAKQGKFGKGL